MKQISYGRNSRTIIFCLKSFLLLLGSIISKVIFSIFVHSGLVTCVFYQLTKGILGGGFKYIHACLGKISNLTSILFRWVVQPPIRILRRIRDGAIPIQHQAKITHSSKVLGLENVKRGFQGPGFWTKKDDGRCHMGSPKMNEFWKHKHWLKVLPLESGWLDLVAPPKRWRYNTTDIYWLP